jgi:hypothetical protein
MEGMGFMFGKRISGVKILKYVSFLFGFFIIYLIGGYQGREGIRKAFRENLKGKWSGIVTKKYYLRGEIIVIDGIEGQWEIFTPSACLSDSARIGDTIIKEMNTNNCSILRGRKISCDCYYYE